MEVHRMKTAKLFGIVLAVALLVMTFCSSTALADDPTEVINVSNEGTGIGDGGNSGDGGDGGDKGNGGNGNKNATINPNNPSSYGGEDGSRAWGLLRDTIVPWMDVVSGRLNLTMDELSEVILRTEEQNLALQDISKYVDNNLTLDLANQKTEILSQNKQLSVLRSELEMELNKTEEWNTTKYEELVQMVKELDTKYTTRAASHAVQIATLDTNYNSYIQLLSNYINKLVILLLMVGGFVIGLTITVIRLWRRV